VFAVVRSGVDWTSEVTPTPDFFIVGAPKSGTTALYSYLNQHPDVFLPARKDLPFFGQDLDLRFSWHYGREHERLDQYLSWFSAAAGVKRIGDACVWYLLSTCAAEEIRAFAPHARIVAILRNPADMMYAQHSQFLTNLNENLPDFADALAAEVERAKGRRIPRHAHLPRGLQYRETARYAEQIERYFSAFGRERVHVLLYDEFCSNTADEVRKVLQFLGVDDSAPLNLKVVNANRSVRSRLLQRIAMAPPTRLEAVYHGLTPKVTHGVAARAVERLNLREEPRPQMDCALRSRLVDEMASDVRRLSELLDRDLSAWI
jgi:Sulfotransferase family